MASHFVEADEEFVEELQNNSEHKTPKIVKTTGLTFFNNGQRREKKKNEQLEGYKVPQLNKALPQFFAEIRKGSGKEYEPDSVKVTQAALDRHLR